MALQKEWFSNEDLDRLKESYSRLDNTELRMELIRLKEDLKWSRLLDNAIRHEREASVIGQRIDIIEEIIYDRSPLKCQLPIPRRYRERMNL